MWMEYQNGMEKQRVKCNFNFIFLKMAPLRYAVRTLPPQVEEVRCATFGRRWPFGPPRAFRPVRGLHGDKRSVLQLTEYKLISIVAFMAQSSLLSR
jgi:hypothetical protein